MSRASLDRVLSKLTFLEDYLAKLRELQKVNVDDFVGDYRLFGSAERFFQLAIETVLDITKILAADHSIPRPDSSDQLIHELAAHGIVEGELAGRLDGMARFRNLLVHEYEKIDRAHVHERLQRNLADLEAFREAMKAYLRAQNVE